MLLFLVTCWSLVWMYTTEVRGVKTLKLIAATGNEAAEAEEEERLRAVQQTGERKSHVDPGGMVRPGA
jgi:hypothetical protein